MYKPTCARPQAIPSGANTSVKSRRPRVIEEKSVNLSQSWLNHVFRVFSVQRTEGVCHVQNFHRQMRCSRVDSVLPVPGVKPLPPPSDVLVGIPCSTTVILATFPPEKDHGGTLFQKSHIPCTKRRDSKPTFPSVGMTHTMEANANNTCRFTASSRFQARNDGVSGFRQL